MENDMSLVYAGSLGAVGLAVMEADEELPGEECTRHDQEKDEDEDHPGERIRSSKDHEE